MCTRPHGLVDGRQVDVGAEIRHQAAEAAAHGPLAAVRGPVQARQERLDGREVGAPDAPVTDGAERHGWPA